VLTRCLLAAWFVALAGASPGRSADFFLLHPNDASPGDRVTVSYGPTGSVQNPRRFNLYLVRNEEADTVTSPKDARLTPLGVIQIGEKRDGALSFIVPELRGGTYVIASSAIGPCPHRGICGPAFYAASVGEQIVPQYRRRMTLRLRGDSVWPWAARYTWPLGVLIASAIVACFVVAARRTASTR